MRLRCFLFKYSVGGDVLRWLRDDGQHWMQQVFVMRMRDEKLEYTGDDPSTVFFKVGVEGLIEEGVIEEL